MQVYLAKTTDGVLKIAAVEIGDNGGAQALELDIKDCGCDVSCVCRVQKKPPRLRFSSGSPYQNIVEESKLETSETAVSLPMFW